MKTIIYLDTNVLMTFYQYPIDVTTELINFLESDVEGELVIPERVFYEYERNRAAYFKTINKPNYQRACANRFNNAKTKILESIAQLENIKEMKSFGTDYFSILNEFKATSNKRLADLESEISTASKDYLATYTTENDPVYTFVNNHKSSISTTFMNKLKLAQEGITRSELNIKPGITDKNKTTKNGDYVLNP